MYIIMDLDHTLLGEDRTVSQYSLDVLKECKKRGHIIVFNTARSYLNTKELIDLVKPDYAILNGGVLITSPNDIIYQNLICADDTNKIIEILKNDGTLEFSTESVSGFYVNSNEYAKTNKLATYCDFKDSLNEGSYKILFETGNSELAFKIAKDFHLDITHYLGGKWYRLAMADKHDGNNALFKLLDDNNPKAICFGDDLGDLRMLLNAYHGVCLKNSQDILLEQVKNITLFDHNDDGVAKYLEELIQKNEI